MAFPISSRPFNKPLSSAMAPALSFIRTSTRAARRLRASPGKTPRHSGSYGTPIARKCDRCWCPLLYNAPMPREQLVDRLSGPKAKELLSHAQHDLFSVVRKHFVDERIRTLFTSYMHVITTENVPGAGIVFPAIFANIASFTLPVGGAVSLAFALARVVEAGGGEIITNADVKEIKVVNGRATGVKLADGRTIGGRKFVASAIDFPDDHANGRRRTISRTRCGKNRNRGIGVTIVW